MTRINLLPWREMRRKQKQRDFVTMIAVAAMLAVGGVFGVNFYISQLIEHQVARNDYLRAEIAKLKKESEEIKKINETKARLLSRLEVIQNLQSSRPVMVKIFDNLVRLVPEDIYLSSFRTEGDQLVINGTARSNNVVSEFMRNLGDSPLFGEPVLRVIQNKEVNGIRVSDFELAVRRAKPKGEEEDEEQL